MYVVSQSSIVAIKSAYRLCYRFISFEEEV